MPWVGFEPTIPVFERAMISSLNDLWIIKSICSTKMEHVEHTQLLRGFETMALNLMQKRFSQQKLQNGNWQACRIRYTQKNFSFRFASLILSIAFLVEVHLPSRYVKTF
jgi:hypothetical protein